MRESDPGVRARGKERILWPGDFESAKEIEGLEIGATQHESLSTEMVCERGGQAAGKSWGTSGSLVMSCCTIS